MCAIPWYRYATAYLNSTLKIGFIVVFNIVIMNNVIINNHIHKLLSIYEDISERYIFQGRFLGQNTNLVILMDTTQMFN